MPSQEDSSAAGEVRIRARAIVRSLITGRLQVGLMALSGTWLRTEEASVAVRGATWSLE